MSFEPGDEFSGKIGSCGAQMDWGGRCSDCGECCGELECDADPVNELLQQEESVSVWNDFHPTTSEILATATLAGIWLFIVVWLS